MTVLVDGLAEQLCHRKRSVCHLALNDGEGSFGATVQNVVGAEQRDVDIAKLHVHAEGRVGLTVAGIELVATSEEARSQFREHDWPLDEKTALKVDLVLRH